MGKKENKKGMHKKADVAHDVFVVASYEGTPVPGKYDGLNGGRLAEKIERLVLRLEDSSDVGRMLSDHERHQVQTSILSSLSTLRGINRNLYEDVALKIFGFLDSSPLFDDIEEDRRQIHVAINSSEALIARAKRLLGSGGDFDK